LHNRYNSEINIKYDLVSVKEVMKIRFHKYIARGDLLDGDMSAMNVIIDAIFEVGLVTIVQHQSGPYLYIFVYIHIDIYSCKYT
jgi:hypothetical protein